MSEQTIYDDNGVEIWRGTFGHFQKILVNCLNKVLNSKNSRIEHLSALYSSIIEDAISIDILLKDSRLNQSYIIARALLERTVNLCYLLMTDDQTYKKYIDYSKNKAVRSHKRSFEVDRTVLASFNFNSKFPDDYEDAVEKFTSDKGREIERWGVNINKRAKFVNDNGGPNFYFDIMFIYGDASEAIHGTLYGSLFHLGIYSPERPQDKESLSKWRCSSICQVYLISTGILKKLMNVMENNGLEIPEYNKLLNDIWDNAISKSDLKAKI